MFDITSSKLLILAVVALIVVGPKDLPLLLRTVGKYMGMIKRQAAEFRQQFDDAMRDSELAELKKDVETLGQEAKDTLREVERTVDKEMDEVKREVDPVAERADQAVKSEATAVDADGFPVLAGDLPPAPVKMVTESGAPAAAEPVKTGA